MFKGKKQTWKSFLCGWLAAAVVKFTQMEIASTLIDHNRPATIIQYPVLFLVFMTWVIIPYGATLSILSLITIVVRKTAARDFLLVVLCSAAVPIALFWISIQELWISDHEEPDEVFARNFQSPVLLLNTTICVIVAALALWKTSNSLSAPK